MMTTPKVRKQVVADIDESMRCGARQSKACALMGIAATTLRRWRPSGGAVLCDQRPHAKRPEPRNKLSLKERESILEVCNSEAYSQLPPSQIVPRLADDGRYLASESTFYRVLHEANQVTHRGRSNQAQTRPISTHVAHKANEVWMWDITYLPTPVKGQHYYLYLIEDLYSRYGVHWEVHERECGELASDLLQQASLKAQLRGQPLVLHSDNGSPMTCYTLQAKLTALGIHPSHSRPRVSNDNAYVESLFRTVKYCPQWPSQGFKSVDAARQWVAQFMGWYNEHHRHSGIRFVTPGQRYRGEDVALLQRRRQVYEAARQANPLRWSSNTRNWQPDSVVALNPEKRVLSQQLN